ncbi:DUF4367 domain-containing protein [Paenibacillus sp. DMB20]|uniref:DUF4367 domain-containing protein n=1 Tax=Paenibacillus sp. DMB20 TaxID=1642570 RepID=UPI000627AACA|nr:DUF4367 domain-containing protein [Paenibacillus sp. DMB20]KKO51659.1 hypothetical protein XI25_24850 [Paenibacillus sp. DMB20]
MNLTKKMIIAATSILLVLGSASGFATEVGAAPQKQSKTQATSNKSNLERQKKEAMDIFHPQDKKPGYLTVLYDGTDNSLSFSYLGITSSDYNEYTKMLSKYKAPELQQPGGIPEGYVFKSGEIVPPYPLFLTKAYESMLKELKAEANGKKYYAKKLKWNEAGGAAVIFSKDSDVIRISSQKVQPLITEVTRVPSKAEKFENLSINGTDAIYSTNSNDLYSTKLRWEDAEKQFQYEISIYKKSPLIKEDLVAIAESMIQE